MLVAAAADAAVGIHIASKRTTVPDTHTTTQSDSSE